MNKFLFIIVSILFVAGISVILFGQAKNDSNQTDSQSTKNVEIKDGIQYITIRARGGYSPKVSVAQAGVPTKLIVETNGTFDCSASLVIKAINYEKILSQTGKEVIDLGAPQVGTLRGLCSMGMYNFSVQFK